MVKFLLWTIYFYDFGSYLFDRELFYEKVCFLSGLIQIGFVKKHMTYHLLMQNFIAVALVVWLPHDFE